MPQPKGIQILTRVSESVLSINTFLIHLNSPAQTPDSHSHSLLEDHFAAIIEDIHFVANRSSEDSLILPEDFIEELKHAGLLT
jgi:hypothetical protein